MLLAKCPYCLRLKMTINHGPDKQRRRIRSHRVRVPGMDLTQLQKMPRCEGSLTVVKTVDTQPL